MDLPVDLHKQDAFSSSYSVGVNSTPQASLAPLHTLPVSTNKPPGSLPPMPHGPSIRRTGTAPQLSSVKSQPVASPDQLPESNLSPPMLPSTSPGPRARMSGRTLSERSPSPHTRVAPPSALAEAMSMGCSPGIGRSPSLIRRLSRGASNKLRRRASTQHSMRLRDPSAGPTLIRRLSDSNGATDVVGEVSDFELDSTTEDAIEDVSYPSSFKDRSNGLGITYSGRPSITSSTVPTVFEGGIAPANSVVLENGTWLTKLTKRQTKRIKLWLDPNAARVCWHSSNPSKSFFIDDVREVRVGIESRNARDDVQIPADQEGRWVTIVYDVPERSKGRNIKTMHVLMPDDYILKLWTDALNTVTRERIEIMNALSSSPEKSEKSMLMAWHRVMSRKSPVNGERFSLDDARWLCRKLEINCTDSAVRTHYRSVTANENTGLDWEQYRAFVRSFRERKDIQHVYRNLKCGTDLDMDLKTFIEFLKNDQMIDLDKEQSYWEGIFNKYATVSKNAPALPDAPVSVPQRTLNMQTFQNFMTSGHTAPVLTYKSAATVLDKPLNEYFISSSHNTYLLGRQVAGASSVEGYIAALVKGCRCIEIDCWDGDDGRPMVTHGRTMTTKIPFEDCVSVVSKYAFNSSPYPIIVSLEVHCGIEQQLAMVELMRRYFGPMMVTEPIVPNSTTLPSPEELKGRILIKVKASEDHEPAHSYREAITVGETGRSRARSITAFVRTPSAENQSVVSSPLIGSSVATSPSETNTVFTSRGSATSGPSMTPNSSAEDSDEVPLSMERPKKRKTSRITPELGKLGIYTQGIKFGGFESYEARTYNHVYSFGENTFDRLCLKHTDDKAFLEKHNMRYLMRVYPGPRRIDSSNFNPLQSWRRGVQMAALNWQTYDVHQQVNEAMFAAGSDKLGYVLKPDELRHPKHLPIIDMLPEAMNRKERKGKKVVKFSVEIISAQRLPRPRNQSAEAGMNPYIEFEMYSAEDKARGNAFAQGGTDASARDGTSGIGSPLRKRTRIVEGNGFDPQYYETITMAVETKHPSLIFVRWTVWNAPEGKKSASNSALLATFTAKLSSLQQGYRHLPLFNPQGEQYRDAKLFVKIKKEAPVPATYLDDAAFGMADPSASPRPWPLRIFSRNPSQRRLRDTGNDVAGPISRTSSMDRESLR